MRFFSDNAAPAHPKVLEAIAAANRLDTAYDGDEWSQRLDGAFSDLFGTEVRAFWVTTGTAANCLALAALCPPTAPSSAAEMPILRSTKRARPAFSPAARSWCCSMAPAPK